LIVSLLSDLGQLTCPLISFKAVLGDEDFTHMLAVFPTHFFQILQKKNYKYLFTGAGGIIVN
jgi:hypothetical protein